MLEASANVGIGHLMRCLCLADELAKHHWQPIFFCEQQNSIASTFCDRYPIVSIHKLASTAGIAQLVQQLAQLPTLDAIVIDHYQLSADWCQQLKAQVDSLIVVLDDIHRPFTDIDLLVSFASLPPQATLTNYPVLAGAEFSLIRDEFLQQSTSGSAEHFDVMVNFGGSDPELFTLAVLAQLNRVQAPMQIKLVVGSAFPAMFQLTQMMQESKHHIVLDIDCRQMADAMCSAKVVILAAGISAFEAAALGRPMLLLQTDPCQIHNYQLFQQHHAAMCSSLTTFQDDLQQLLSTDRTAMIRQARQLCNGQGKIIIFQHIQQLLEARQ